MNNLVEETIDLWEAWVDTQCPCNGGGYGIHVLGEIFMGTRTTIPVLVKKNVQGAAADHLYLEILPHTAAKKGTLVELRYTDCVHGPDTYSKVTICMGEDVIATINDIETVY